jgi:Fe-S-cluster-containing hydrogenase component 2
MKRGISRREFLRDAGLALGGAATGAGGAAFIFFDRQRALTDIPRAPARVTQVPAEESACTGCGTCELVCAAAHGNSVGPSVRRIWLERDAVNLVFRVSSCLQCDYPACYYACPARGEAMRIDARTSVRYIVTGNCQPGCRDCIDACKAAPPRINFDTEARMALMCDLCRDRQTGPACVEYCPAQCLRLEA